MSQPRGRGNESRLNEYFVDGTGISREVIQADICRYLGNDALVRPAVHEGRSGYFLRAYRNLTSGMIADLQHDSARWEADRQYREARGQGAESYRSAAYHDPRADPGYQAAGPPYGEAGYGAPRSSQPTHQGYQYSQPSDYPSVPATSPPYPQPPPQVPVTTSDVPPQYVHAPGNNYAYQDPSNAPRYSGGVYDRSRPEFQQNPPSGMAYPPSSSPDQQRLSPMDPAYGSGPSYPRGQSGRPPPPSDPHRRAR